MTKLKRESFHAIEGTLECVSGLRIGGSTDEHEIGGVDLPVIKHPTTKKPYVPGSSLKGKMRNELEKHLGRFGKPDGTQQHEPCMCALPTCPVCRVFGPHKEKSRVGPTRIIVRDAPLLSGGDIELKTENIINREHGAAEHPRKLERVAAGSTFGAKLTVQVYNIDSTFDYKGKKGKDAILGVVRDCLDMVAKTGLGSGV